MGKFARGPARLLPWFRRCELKEGEEIEADVVGERTLEVARKAQPLEWLARLRQVEGQRSRQIFRFDRLDANEEDRNSWMRPGLLRHQRRSLSVVGRRAQGRCGRRPTLAQGGWVSVPVLNEAASVCRRKLKLPWPEVHELLAAVKACCEVVPVSLAAHERALHLAERYQLSLYDALICASAQEVEAEVLFTESVSKMGWPWARCGCVIPLFERSGCWLSVPRGRDGTHRQPL